MITDRPRVLFEEASEGPARFYVLTVVRAGNGRHQHPALATPGAPRRANKEVPSVATANWEIAQKIWFDRSDLRVARIENFGPGGKVASDVGYGNWQATAATSYPWQINVTRPSDDYQLQITIKKLTVNEPIAADRFSLPQPPGTDLINLGENAGGDSHKDSGQSPEPQH